jgi:hypothetical protein
VEPLLSAPERYSAAFDAYVITIQHADVTTGGQMDLLNRKVLANMIGIMGHPQFYGNTFRCFHDVAELRAQIGML